LGSDSDLIVPTQARIEVRAARVLTGEREGVRAGPRSKDEIGV
jgi:hypothetical protein